MQDFDWGLSAPAGKLYPEMLAVEPTGPQLEDLLPLLLRIQARRIPMHLTSTDWKQAERLMANLSPRGLAITCVPVGQAGALAASPRAVGETLLTERK